MGGCAAGTPGTSPFAARPEPAGQLDEVSSLEAIVRELTPILGETLAGITGD